jgi:predicted alpha/beta-hydrolase family hydrolase
VPARSSTRIVAVDTPAGLGRFFIDSASEPVAALVLGHGAGGGVTAFDLELLATRLPPAGVTVARFEQPWRTSGKKVAVPPSQLDVCWRAAIDFWTPLPEALPRLFFGGRSAGARVACRTAPDFDVAGVVCLSFPLHLPGKPEMSRIDELLRPNVPRLVLQGGNDAFGRPAEVVAAIGDAAQISVVELPGADHGFRVAKAARFSAADLRAVLVSEVTAFVRRTAPSAVGGE